uniref:Gsp_10 putative toxin n=1 Tax=Gemmula speciosa TaxID=439592 RepID=A0A098LXV4_GEMSP
MRFHVLLTVALLLTSLMSIEAKPVNGAEMERFALKTRGVGIKTLSPECVEHCGHCLMYYCEDPGIESCVVSCTYCAYNCGTPSSVD